MSDEKDPVREQIERDTREWCQFQMEDESDFDSWSHDQGRDLQDTIAWNRCLDAVKELADRSQDQELWADGYNAMDSFKKELEKLRR